MTGPRRVHRGYVSRTKTTGGVRSGDVVVSEPGMQFQAFCHGCRWAGDVTAYEPLAREQARAHSDKREGERG